MKRKIVSDGGNRVQGWSIKGTMGRRDGGSKGQRDRGKGKGTKGRWEKEKGPRDRVKK